MEYKIIDIYEEGNSLHVVVEHDFGSDNLGLGIHTGKLDPRTDKPRWMEEVDKLLEMKYGDDNRKPKKVFKEFVGKKFTHDKINVVKTK